MKLLPVIFAATAFAATANAASGLEASGEWTLLEETNGKAIYSSEAGAPALVIGCNDAGKISATFSLDGNVTDKLQSRSTRTRQVEGTLTIEGKGSETAQWAYLPTRNMAAPVENKFARRLYNAVVTGSKVTLDLGRRGTFEYAPPSVNADFQTFASGCIAK